MLGVYSVRRFTPSTCLAPYLDLLPLACLADFLQGIPTLRWFSFKMLNHWDVQTIQEPYASSMNLHYGWRSCYFEQTLTRYVSWKWSNLFKAFSKQSLPMTEDRVVQLRFAAIAGYHSITKSKIRGCAEKGNTTECQNSWINGFEFLAQLDE